jgi:uncharacterized GH25 family protein
VKRATVLLCLLLAAPSEAHDYWLVPETFAPKEGANVPVRVFVGAALKAEQEAAYSPKRTAVLQLVCAAKSVTEFPNLKDGGKPALAFTMPAAGTAVLRYDRDWSSIALKADKFNAYLKEEGLEAILQARGAAKEAGAEGKERYRRCLKTIVHGGGKPDDTPIKPLGQVLEVVPGKNPYALTAGDELPVTVLFERKPIAGLKVTAHHRAGDTLTTASAVTDAAGKAALKLTKPGTWVVRTVHMRRVAETAPTPAADWESFWASVTFAVP